MDRRLLLTALRWLLDLARRCVRRSLYCLLRIYSTLSERRKLSRLPGSKDDAKTDRHDTGLLSHQDVLYEGHDGALDRPVVLACSSTPRKPPPARSYTRHTSIESYGIGPTCISPTSTLRESPSTTSPSSFLADDQGILTRELSSPPDSFTAAPVHLINPPQKPITPTFPTLTPRYERNIVIQNNKGPWIFRPLESITVYDDLAVPLWKHYVQPEGQLYFHNDSRRFNYITEAHLCNPTILAEAELFISAFERKAEDYKSLPINVEVVLEINDKCWEYYMVDLDRRCLFWLDDCIVDDDVLPGNFGVENREHFRHMFDFEYWSHIDYFPNHRTLQKGLLDELMGILVQTHVDVITSLSSTSPYDEDELRALLGTVKQMQGLQTSECAIPYIIHASARIMCLFANERYYNFSGFHGARLSQLQSVRGQATKPRSLLMRMLSPILFYSPEVHLTGLEKVWIDNVVKMRLWKAFQAKVERDWEGFVLYSTVLLNANVAFLSIPSIMSDNFAPTLLVSPAAVASQVSIVASLGSIIIGLLLVRQMRIGTKASIEDYLAFLENRDHPQLGLETLAILYGLPYALLMWGMALFLASISIACFYNMNGSTTFLTRILYGAVWLFVVILILWTIITGWEKKSNLNWRWLLPQWCQSRDSDSSNSAVKSGLEEAERTEETEMNSFDARSVRSRHSVRSRFTVSSTVASTIGRSWRSRMRNLAERQRPTLHRTGGRDMPV